jgi:hypothetical protein
VPALGSGVPTRLHVGLRLSALVPLLAVAGIGACSSAPTEPVGTTSAGVDATLTLAEVETYAKAAGVPCGALDPSGYHSVAVAGAVSQAESSLCTNSIGGGGLGLWQIQASEHAALTGSCDITESGTCSGAASCTGGDWTSPSVNASWMASISGNGTDWAPWCTYGNCCDTGCASAPYLEFIASAETAYASVCAADAPAPVSTNSQIGQTAAAIALKTHYADPSGTGFCNIFTQYWYSLGDSVPSSSACATTPPTRSEEWCADFAAWVWQQAGVKFNYGFGAGDLNAGAVSFYDYGVALGTWHSAGAGYVPQPGDAVVYGLGPNSDGVPNSFADHVGIVVGQTPGSPYPDVVNGDYNYSIQAVANCGTNYCPTNVCDGQPGCGTISGYASPVVGSGPAPTPLPPPPPPMPLRVGLAMTLDGNGYWEVATNGGVFSYGSAVFHGSMGSALVSPRQGVGMAMTPDGNGYWLVGADGGVFTFGDANFYGSLATLQLNKPIVGIAPTHDGKGYWLVGADGGVFSLGDAVFHGSLGGTTLNAPIVGMAVTPDGGGYWLAGADGGVFAFGDAGYYNSLPGEGVKPAEPIIGIGRTEDGKGYWLAGADGGVFTFGDAAFFGSATNTSHAPITAIAAAPSGAGYWLMANDGTVYPFGNAPTPGSHYVAMARTADGNGYWEVSATGGVYAYGDAGWYGAVGSTELAKPIVDIVATPDSKGYWLVGADGGIFTFGDAGYYGSLPAEKVTPAKPIVGMAATPSGGGYWLAGADGGIFTFGDAGYYNSLPGLKVTPAKPIVGIEATPDGKGYWLVGADGGIFSFGDAGFYGSEGGKALSKPVVGMVATSDGKGYWLVGADGGIFSFGDAGFYGSLGGTSLAAPIVGMAARPTGNGYWLVGQTGSVFTYGAAGYPGGVQGSAFVKSGNNGTVSCDTYCAGSEWGKTGTCLGSYINDLSCGVTLGLLPGDSEEGCTCSSAGTSFSKGGDNGTVDCKTFCAGSEWGKVGTCTAGSLVGSSHAIIGTSSVGYAADCTLVPGLLSGTELSCVCAP